MYAYMLRISQQLAYAQGDGGEGNNKKKWAVRSVLNLP
jgi:hypothetical protein